MRFMPGIITCILLYSHVSLVPALLVYVVLMLVMSK